MEILRLQQPLQIWAAPGCSSSLSNPNAERDEDSKSSRSKRFNLFKEWGKKIQKTTQHFQLRIKAGMLIPCFNTCSLGAADSTPRCKIKLVILVCVQIILSFGGCDHSEGWGLNLWSVLGVSDGSFVEDRKKSCFLSKWNSILKVLAAFGMPNSLHKD